MGNCATVEIVVNKQPAVLIEVQQNATVEIDVRGVQILTYYDLIFEEI